MILSVIYDLFIEVKSVLNWQRFIWITITFMPNNKISKVIQYGNLLS